MRDVDETESDKILVYWEQIVGKPEPQSDESERSTVKDLLMQLYESP